MGKQKTHALSVTCLKRVYLVAAATHPNAFSLPSTILRSFEKLTKIEVFP